MCANYSFTFMYYMVRTKEDYSGDNVEINFLQDSVTSLYFLEECRHLAVIYDGSLVLHRVGAQTPLYPPLPGFLVFY